MAPDACSASEVYADGTTVVFIPRGDLTEELLKQYLACCDQVIARAGFYCVLIDITQLGAISTLIRKRAAEWARKRPVNSSMVALCGGNAVRKALVLLILRAVQIVAGKALNVRFFSTESEARTWLATHPSSAQKLPAERF